MARLQVMSASGACSVDGEWGLESLGPAFPSVDVSEFSRVITCEMGKIRDKCCSVEAFLQMRLQDPEAARGFVKFLLSCWPLLGAVDFCTESVFPTSREAEGDLHLIHLHVACLSWLLDASVKWPTEWETAMNLQEEVLLHGFVTAGEPLRVTQVAELVTGAANLNLPKLARGVLAASVGYLKGKARASVLLDEGLDVKERHPKLWETVCDIHAYCVFAASKTDELLSNFRLSVKGSIRKPPNVMCESW